MAGTVSEQHSLQTIRFGQTRITFALTFTPRRSLRITVEPDQRVVVEAPGGRTLDEVLARVNRRAAWIVRQKEHFRRFQPSPTPRRYLSGETHLYLGRQYRLKLIPDDREEVKLVRGYFQVVLRDTHDRARVKRLLERWFASHGSRVIAERVAKCQEAMRRLGVPAPTTVVCRRMHKRWGSCGRKNGTILLNRELVHAPLSCIDYVITHELCHLKYPSHSREFHFLLSQCMADWRKRKEKLETALL